MGVRFATIFVCALLGCEATTLTGDDGGDGSVIPRLCILDRDIVEDTVLGVDFCGSYLVEIPVAVREGATLTIAAGTELRFGRNAGLSVGARSDGRLAIHGTPNERVLLTSLAPSDDDSGRWKGVSFLGSTLPGSVIRYATIQNATGEAGGCLSLQGTAPGAVELEGVRIERCSSAGLWVDVPKLDPIPPLVVSNAKYGISVAARNVGSIRTPLQLEGVTANEVRGGAVTESASWIAQGVPWVVGGDVQVQGPTSPVLTLEPGLHLRFAQSTWLIVGHGEPGGLIARGTEGEPVTLEANNPGGWHGVVIGEAASRSTELAYTVLRGGGRRGEDVRGCLTIRGSTPIAITRSRFEACEQAGIGAIAPFFRFASLSGNTFVDSNVGLHLNARAVGSIAEEQRYERVLTNMIEGDELGKSAIWVRQSVPWTVRDSITVQGAEEPVLRLSPGVRLRFAPSSWIQIGSAESGGLVAIGDSSDPVVFESSSAQPGRGAWRGIVFGRNARAGSRIERALVRHGGQAELDVAGCITVRGTTPRPITIVRTTFESCAQGAIAALEGGTVFEAVAENVFRDSDAGLHLAASAVASITAPQIYETVPFNRMVGDRISTSASWLPQDVPWIVRGTISVEGSDAPELRFEPGLELRFEDGAQLRAGTTAPARLVIAGSPQLPVVLGSAQEFPQPGDWAGILLGPYVELGTRADYLILSNAGQPLPDMRGAITLMATDTRVRIASSQFRENSQADIFVDCMSQPLLTGNLYSTLGVRFETCM